MQEADSPSTGKVLRIGALFPLNGKSETAGLQMKKGALLAIDIVNGEYPEIGLPLAKNKGLRNIGGATVEIHIADHANSAEKGMNEAERLIVQQKVATLIVASETDIIDKAAFVAKRYGKPIVNTSVGSASSAARNFDNYFEIMPDEARLKGALLLFLNGLKTRALFGEGKIALISSNNSLGQENEASFIRVAKDQKITLSVELKYPTQDAAQQAFVGNMKSGGFNAVIHALTLQENAALLKSYRDKQFNIDLIINGNYENSEADYLATVGENGQYMLSSHTWAVDLGPKKPLIQKVAKLFKDKYGVDMTESAAQAFTAVWVLCEAADRAGSVDSTALLKSLETIEIPAERLITPGKGLKFDAKSRRNYQGSVILRQIQSGKLVTVWPAEPAAAALIIPSYR